MAEIFIFIFGLAIGSFLNSVIYRLENKESFLLKRSYCPNCKHKLVWLDLIPLFSFLFLKGKCRWCQKSISPRYPLVELLTGAVFALIFKFYPVSNLSQLITILYLFIIFSFLIVIFVYDLKHYFILDKVIYPAIGMVLIYNFLSSKLLNSGVEPAHFFNSVYSAFGAAALFLAIVLVSGGKWMGVGDIKLAFLMGLFLGFPNVLIALFSAFLIGAIIGTGLIIFGRKTLKSEVPLGPFLASGTFIAFFWGQKIINWYAKSFYLT